MDSKKIYWSICMLKIFQLRKKSIKNQLLIDFGAILISVCVISYIAIYLIFSNMLEKNREDTTDIITNVAISQARIMINTVETIISKVADVELLKDINVPIEERLQAVEVSAPIMYRLALFDRDGTGIVSSGEKINARDDKILEKAMAGEISSFNIASYKDQDYIAFLRPITDNQGEIQSVVTAFLGLEDFFERIMQVSRGEIGYIANPEGLAFWGLIDSNGESKCGKIKNLEGLDRIFEDELIYDQEYTLEMQEMYTGEPIFLTYGLIGQPNWIVGVARLVKQPKQALNVFHVAMFWGMLLMFGIGMIIVYIIASSISKRMNGIANYLGNSIKSEFKETIPPELLKNEDEIGMIAKEVKHLEEEMVEMLDSIKTSIDYLNDIK